MFSGIQSNSQQIMVQLSGMAFVAVFAPLSTVVILTVLRLMFGSLRVEDENEMQGLDLSEHSESAYGFAGGGVLAPELSAQAGHRVAMSLVAPQEHSV